MLVLLSSIYLKIVYNIRSLHR